MKCPVCNTENIAGTPLCRECGTTLPVGKEPPASPSVVNADLSSDASDEATAVATGDAAAFASAQAAAAFGWVGEVRKLAAAGQKIEAIKLFRQRSGAGLKEAKVAVEAIEQGKPIAITATHVSTDPQSLGRVLELLKAGNKIEAIKIVRSETGQDLASAKALVEAIMQGQGSTQISIGSGTRKATGVGVLVVAVLVAGAVVLLWTLFN